MWKANMEYVMTDNDPVMMSALSELTNIREYSMKSFMDYLLNESETLDEA
jgi:hypothetical protein